MRSFHQTYTRIKEIHNLISRKATGNPDELSRKLGISKSYLYIIINLMKELGAPIFFDRDEQSYCYYKKIKLEKTLFSPEEDLTLK